METDRIRYFCAIAETGSLTKASELLGVSHSGLSKAMAVLQNEVGYKVLIPKGRGLELTAQGKELYEKGRKILEMVNSLKSETTSIGTPLRIAFPEVVALAASETIAKEITGEITIEDLDSGELEARVLDRRIDFAFTFVPFPDKDLDHLKIASVAISSFCLNGKFRGIEPDKIPYVIPAAEMKDNPLSIRIRDGWNPNLPRLTPFKAGSLSIALKLVQAGGCAIYTPDFMISYLNKFEAKGRQLTPLELPVQRKNKERTHRNIFLVKRAAEEESKLMKAVVRIVRQICKGNQH